MQIHFSSPFWLSRSFLDPSSSITRENNLKKIHGKTFLCGVQQLQTLQFEKIGKTRKLKTKEIVAGMQKNIIFKISCKKFAQKL